MNDNYNKTISILYFHILLTLIKLENTYVGKMIMKASKMENLEMCELSPKKSFSQSRGRLTLYKIRNTI